MDCYVICSPNRKKFINVGEGNCEGDTDIVTAKLHRATLFETEKAAAQHFKGKPTTKDYWGSSELAKFYKTACVRVVELSLGEQP